MRLQRNELARLYHWKQRNRLPPLNLTPFGRTGLVDFLHGASTLGTSQDRKRPRHDILHRDLKPA